MAVNLSSPSWAPPGESSADLFTERTNLDGSILGGIAYGIFVTLYFITMHDQLKSLRKKWWQIIYLNLLLAFSTIYLAASTKWVQQMFIDFRNFHLSDVPIDGYDPTDPTAAGPLGFYNYAYNTPMIVLGNSAYIVLNFLADGLVLYRCLLIWNMNYKIIAFPLLVFLGEIACAIVTVWNNSLPNAKFFGNVSHSLVTAWIVMSMCLNIVLTLLITGRIFYAKKRLIGAYGARHAKRFTSVGTIVVESALLYSFLSLLTLIFYELPVGNAAINFVNILLPLLTQSMCIAPTLILLRLAREKAFTRAAALASVTGTTTELVEATPAQVDLESRLSGTQELKHD